MTNFLIMVLVFIGGAVAWQLITGVVGVVTGDEEKTAEIGMGVGYLLIIAFNNFCLWLAKVLLIRVRFYSESGVYTTRFVPRWRVKWFKTEEESDGKFFIEISKEPVKTMPTANLIMTGKNIYDHWTLWTDKGQEQLYFANWAKGDSPMQKKVKEMFKKSLDK